MRRPTLVRFCFFALLVVLIATFAQGRTRTYADSASIGGANSPYFDIPGLYFNSYASLTEAVPGSPFYQSIHITNMSSGCLRVGWTVKVDQELMLINQLIPGTSGNPDTMVVARAQGGTAAGQHTATTIVQTRALRVDIMAQNVSYPPYGFGAFNVQIAIPSQLQIIELALDSTWLGSTGRIPDCTDPIQQSPGVWQFQCASLPNPQPGWPSWYPGGPSGSGRIARLTVLQPASGSSTIQLTGSLLAAANGHDLSAAVSPISINVVGCPDTNLDGKVNTTDLLNAARNLNDAGADSGATILSGITATQTQITISDQSRLSAIAPDNIISIDNESMTVVNLVDGSPDTMTVTRGTNYPQPASHKAGAHIYRATTDGNHDGKRAYTPTRDAVFDGIINTTDLLRIARIFVITQTCPAPP